jgi:hypothetical protein
MENEKNLNEIVFNKGAFTKLYRIRLVEDDVNIIDMDKGIFNDLMSEYFNTPEEAETRLMMSAWIFKGEAELCIETVYKKL